MNFKERQKKIQTLEKSLSKLKAKCTHPPSQLDVKDAGSSGNWDPSDDRSWTEYKCRVCGHWWSVDH